MTWPPDIPSARAAWTASWSAPRMPVAVEVKIGGTASTASTPTIGPFPVPRSSTIRTNRPRLGIARAALPADQQEGTSAGVTDQDP